MRIEQYIEFLCTVDEHPTTDENHRLVWKVTGVAIPWQDCEYIPASVAEYSTHENYPFPVKFLKRPKDWVSFRTKIAIRTDVYPLLWVYVWLYLQVENLVDIAWCGFMWHCNRIGLARTKPGFEYSWKDFAIIGFWTEMTTNRLLRIISNLLAGFSAFMWFSSGYYPVVGVIWLTLWTVAQICLEIAYAERDKAIVNHELVEERSRVNSPTRTTEEDVFVYDCVGDFHPAFPSNKQNQLDCIECKYFYGSSGIVCAVLPQGYEGDHCMMREQKVEEPDRNA